MQRGELCICCGQTPCDLHHLHPQSQGGSENGTVPVCRGCHSLYHSICGQRLAKTVKARVRNFGQWMSKFPKSSLMGSGLHPADMAPEFVIQEAGHLLLTRKYKDFSGGRLSRLGKVTQYPPRN